jgi:high-affinity iron transporter
MIKFCLRILPLVASFMIAAPASAEPPAPADTQNVQVAWRLLDYLAVDYPGAVKDGKVISASEFAEMTEFSGSVIDRVKALPDNPKKADLISEAEGFRSAVKAKASADDISNKAHTLGAHLLAAYPVALAPSVAPDFDHGAQLYSENCASCHGLAGDGKGPAAASLNPPPIAFADINRAKNRSVFGLYQVIGQGLDGTAMPSFAHLSDNDRWALAFYAGHFAFQDVQKGEQLWKSDPSLRQRFPDLKALAGTTPSQLASQIGADRAYPLIAYLRTHTSAVVAQPSTLAVSHQRLNEALQAYRAGDQRQAEELALSAYLDGFEPIEPMLSARDGTLLTRIEKEMGALRASIHDHADIKVVESRFATIQSLLGQAEKALAPEATSNTSTFVGAFTILLREGLEALLIVTAMIAFLKKAERNEALPYVHAGWIAALAAGAITWAVATFLIGISGASRELTEGFGSVLATVVLLWVGIWLHGKAQANEWQRFIKETMGHALSKGSSWFLFGLAFVVVYREVFETILFYAALWTKDNGLVILSGAGLAVVGLAVIAWVMLRFSARLPITQFFTFSSALIAVLAIVLAGKGIAALQEAGLIDVSPVSFVPQVELLGIFPTLQSIGAQFVVIAIIIGAFAYSKRKNPQPTPAQ